MTRIWYTGDKAICLPCPDSIKMVSGTPHARNIGICCTLLLCDRLFEGSDTPYIRLRYVIRQVLAVILASMWKKFFWFLYQRCWTGKEFVKKRNPKLNQRKFLLSGCHTISLTQCRRVLISKVLGKLVLCGLWSRFQLNVEVQKHDTRNKASFLN